jgi:glutathione synthase/RimK-type ligase-like ATP-grasp enzyme
MSAAHPPARSRRVALATYAPLPGLSADDQLLLPELAGLGITAEPAVWNDPRIDWTVFDAVILRSCWDYHLQVDAFLAWVARLETSGVAMWNPPHVVRWNAEKGYLHALAASGVPVVATRWVEAGSDVTLARVLADEGWRDAVVKPAVSASAHDTWRIATQAIDGEAESRFRAGVERGRVLVQPFLETIEVDGEWSLVFLDGAFSHSVIKRPRSGDFRVQPEHGGSSDVREAPASVRDQAKRALDAAPGPTLYARVDGCVIDGAFRLMELELLEPSLFLATTADAPCRLARAIDRLIGE